MAAATMAASGVANAVPVSARPALTTATPHPEVNPVVAENRLPGSTGWQIPRPGYVVSSDSGGQVKGYASAASVNIGGTIGLKISTSAATTTQWEVYRLGWYGGTGGRLMRSGNVATSLGPACPTNGTTGEMTCAWPTSVNLTIPTTWLSGAYVVVLTASGHQNAIIFTVRDDARSAAMMDVLPVNTYQAYNGYPAGHGKSLYGYNSYGSVTAGGTTAAVQVSFNRPYATLGDGSMLTDDAPLIRYLEERGFDVKYGTDVDLDQDATALNSVQTTVISGHSEYWTKGMYDVADHARDAGVNLSFLGANQVYWQARYANSRRSLICWRSVSLDPEPDPNLKTTLWRNVGRPEQPLMGSMYPAGEGIVSGKAPWVVSDGSQVVYRGTNLGTGSTLTNLVAGEVNRRIAGVPSPVSSDWTALSRSPFTTSYGGPGTQEGVTYHAPSGALVFTPGTLAWNGQVDSVNNGGVPAVQVMTTNVLARQGNAALSATGNRLAGPDRYATAVAISAGTFAAGSHPTVFIATGTTFPDALGASAATKGSGPVLLVQPNAVPQVVIDELKRLQPAAVHLVGGPDAVSDGVRATVAAVTGVAPDRLSGPDRYATAAAISAATEPVGVEVAYVATGANFPDALAVGSQRKGPVLLAGKTVPASTAAELQRLKPARIVVVGGPDVVSDTVLNALRPYAPITTRRFGTDRYATAIAVARDIRGPLAGGRVVLAIGTDFPDALAAGPIVAAGGGALVLVPRGATLPPSIADEVLRNDPSMVTAVGGPDTVSDGVLAAAVALFAAPAAARLSASKVAPLPAPTDLNVPAEPRS